MPPMACAEPVAEALGARLGDLFSRTLRATASAAFRSSLGRSMEGTSASVMMSTSTSASSISWVRSAKMFASATVLALAIAEKISPAKYSRNCWS